MAWQAVAIRNKLSQCHHEFLQEPDTARFKKATPNAEKELSAFVKLETQFDKFETHIASLRRAHAELQIGEETSD